jgi:hypothetical protein
MSKNQYREFARECMQWAEEAANEADRQHFLEMARAWINAASHDGDPSPAPAANSKRPRRKKTNGG